MFSETIVVICVYLAWLSIVAYYTNGEMFSVFAVPPFMTLWTIIIFAIFVFSDIDSNTYGIR